MIKDFLVKYKTISLTLFCCIILYLGFILFNFFYMIQSPITNDEGVKVDIPYNYNTTQIAHMLENHGVIKDSELFIKLLIKLKSDTKIKAGNYLFTKNSTMFDIINILVSGNVRPVEEIFITIPEGYNKFNIGELLSKRKIADYGKFIDLTTDSTFISSLGLVNYKNINNLEGFLFPETYKIPKNFSEKQIIRMFVKEFIHRQKKLKNKIPADFKNRFSWYKYLILASIIQKETSNNSEMYKVSSVFHNRLRKVMQLGSCAALIYGIPNFDGNIKEKHKRIDSPYNTYKKYGLPITPICNPGDYAILAAYLPATTNYLYFVSKNNGHHYFSKTLKEHNRAVYKYQILKRTD